jgi:hypothetical protein
MRYYLVMPKHTYRLEWNGATVSRTTARTYTFVTVSTGKTVECLRSETEAMIAHQVKEVARYQAVVESGVVPPHPNSTPSRPIRSLLTLDNYREFVVNAGLEIIRLEEKLATYDYAAESAQVKEWGWSSRRDLAEKNAANALGFGYQNVTVLEVPQP